MSNPSTGSGQRAIGEVIQSTTMFFTAQCHMLNQPPALGVLVKAKAGEAHILAAVSEAETSSIDPSRKPVALGMGEEDLEEIYRRNPHLSQLFVTTFQAVVLGYKDDGRYCRHLPPTPVPIHSPVQECGNDEIVEFTSSLTFLDLLYANSNPPLREELIAAFLRRAGAARADGEDFLTQAGRAAVVLMRREPVQLWRLLEMLRP